ncbi:AAA domain-containing protein [Aspergillus varians]
MASILLYDASSLGTYLSRTASDPRPVVMMTCGVTGSGKTTLSKWIMKSYPGFRRLSTDMYIYVNHGHYDVDYPKTMYNEYQVAAERAMRTELAESLQAGKDLILDFTFAFQETRDEWKALIESYGGRWVLVALDVDTVEVKQRVRARNALPLRRKDGDSTFFVNEALLDSFIAGFEWPSGEGEIVMRLDGFVG